VTVKNDDPRSPYAQVADDLRRQIATGRLKAGAKLDSNPKLAEHYGVAVMTIRHALDVLREEGLIVTQQGRGTFVVEDAPGEGSDTGTLTTELASIKEALRQINSRLDRLEDAAREA
jgi:DNA-binding GntR family transcriptional regulator